MLLARVLSRVLGEGQLTIIDAAGRSHQVVGVRKGPAVTMRVHTWWTGVRLALRPRLAFGEAYMAGLLTVEGGSDIYDLLDLLGRNMAALESTPFVRWSYRWQRLVRVLEQYNPIGRAQRNVAHHYDLNGQLYDFFLDRDRQYSCAYFKTGNESLEQAQIDKKHHIAAKMLLQPGQSVLDIGSGWGGMGLFLSQQFGVDVTGVTLSKEQNTVSSRRALESGLADRVRFKLLDYRQEQSRYDRIVSVGMFEHVGVAHYVEYFVGQRHRDPAPALCGNPAPLAPAVPVQSRAHQADGGLRQSLLPHVGVLSRRLRSRLPLHESNGLSDPDRAETGRGAVHARLSGRRRERRRHDALNGGGITAEFSPLYALLIGVAAFEMVAVPSRP